MIDECSALLSYYRDSNAKEIDVFVKLDGLFILSKSRKQRPPYRNEVKKYEMNDKTSIPRGNVGIVCMCDNLVSIDE